jgi:hypothetical protein
MKPAPRGLEKRAAVQSGLALHSLSSALMIAGR